MDARQSRDTPFAPKFTNFAAYHGDGIPCTQSVVLDIKRRSKLEDSGRTSLTITSHMVCSISLLRFSLRLTMDHSTVLHMSISVLLLAISHSASFSGNPSLCNEL